MSKKITLLTLLLLPACASAAGPVGNASSAEIQDLSNKLANGYFNTKMDKQGKVLKCEVTRSTGDPDLDRAFCETFHACAAESAGNTRAAGQCMNRKQDEVFARIAAERAASKAQR